jgi:hypothetical protein
LLQTNRNIKMGKRIRYPKKEKKEEIKQEQEEQKQQTKHFVLDVQNSTISGKSAFGQPGR